jgi:hypothetical protein
MAAFGDGADSFPFVHENVILFTLLSSFDQPDD